MPTFTPTPEGYTFELAGKGTILIPTGFNPTRDVDPIAMLYLEELYAGDTAEADFLGFVQKGVVIQTTTHRVGVASSGLYLMRVVHPESNTDVVQFVRMKWLDELYRGTRREPYLCIEHAIELVCDGASASRQADRIKETFLKTIELLP